MPDGDAIAHAANRIRPALEGRVPDSIVAAREPKWPAPCHPAGDANRTTYWCPGCRR